MKRSMHLEFKDESSSNSSSDTSSSSESEDEGDKDKPIKESVTDKAEKEKVRKEELKRQVGPKIFFFSQFAFSVIRIFNFLEAYQ